MLRLATGLYSAGMELQRKGQPAIFAVSQPSLVIPSGKGKTEAARVCSDSPTAALWKNGLVRKRKRENNNDNNNKNPI